MKNLKNQILELKDSITKVDDILDNISIVRENLLKNHSNEVFSSKDKDRLMQRYKELEKIGKSLYRFNSFKKNNMLSEADNELQNVSDLVLKGGISNTRYIWHSEKGPNTCSKCAELDGTQYSFEDEVPERPHPNCKCYVEVVEDNNENSNSELCECADYIEQIEQVVMDLKSLDQDVQYEIQSIETIVSDTEVTIKDLDETLDLLEPQYGRHLPECENNIDALYDQINAQKFKITVLLTDILGLLNPLNTILGTIYSFVSNYIMLLAERDGNMDKFYHSKANCEAAQRGFLGSYAADALSNAKELYDSFTYIHTHKVSVEEAMADSARDQVANHEGRRRGRMFPQCECSNLMWDLRPPYRR